MRRDSATRYALPLLIMLFVAGLRFHALGQDTRFHPDEALFATFARQAAVNGDWLLLGNLDKPPLTIYANALSMMFTGVTTLPDGVLTLDAHRGEFSARLPGTLASILLVAVMYALARRLYPGERPYVMPLVAMLLMALSPYAIAFSATAFTDGLMLLAITLALWQGAKGQWGWAGLWLAVGFGCKQQALFYVPLVLLLLVRRSRTGRHSYVAGFRRFVLPLVAGIVLLVIWDAARGQDTNLWALAVANNDPGRLVQPDELLPRLSVWLDYAGVMAGTPFVTATLVGLAVVALLARFRRKDESIPRLPAHRTDAILLLYVVAYSLLHWLVAFNLYDRYLLPLLPLVVLLLARGVTWLVPVFAKITDTNAFTGRPRRVAPTIYLFAGICLLMLALFLLPAWDASEGRVPVGGDRGEHAGIDALADYINDKPVATVIYDHWLGWELGYYMGAWTNKRRVYYPTPEALVRDALQLPESEPRYFPAPNDAPVTPWLRALREAGFEVDVDARIGHYTVYALIPPVFSAESASVVESFWPDQRTWFAGWPG
ncbi:MAG: glycosyltransferase family 39 protein [Anaerolineaceae bacterium]|nr:glycosyltransferase family 39 protein [Anaerolineaceae bacterium]